MGGSVGMTYFSYFMDSIYGNEQSPQYFHRVELNQQASLAIFPAIVDLDCTFLCCLLVDAGGR